MTFNSRINHRPDARSDPAADIANLVKRRVFADFGQSDFRHNCAIGEGRAAHVMMDRRAIEHRKPRGSIGQKPLRLGRQHGLTQVCLWVQKILALATFSGV